VDNAWAGFVVFLLGYPHALESGKRRQDGATDPYGVLSLRWSNDLDLKSRWGEGSDFLLHSVGNTWVHGGATRHNNVSEEILADINVASHDRVVDNLMDTNGFHTKEGWLEERFWGSEALITDGDDLTVGKFVRLVERRGSSSNVHLRFEVKSNVGKLFLDVLDDFTFSSGGEGVATLSHDLHEESGDVTASQVKTKDSMGKSITFIDWDDVSYTITRVANLTGGTARGIEGEDSLDGDEHGGSLESLEHHLGHLLAVSLWVEGSLSEEDWRFLGGDAEFIVEGVVPDLLHVIPVGDDTMLNGVLEGHDTTLALGFITDVGVLLTHTDHDTLVTGTANNGWEDSSWSVITGEAGLDHAGAIVYDKGTDFFVTHGG